MTKCECGYYSSNSFKFVKSRQGSSVYKGTTPQNIYIISINLMSKNKNIENIRYQISKLNLSCGNDGVSNFIAMFLFD